VGRHSAADDAVDPIVAAALSRQTASGVRALPRHGQLTGGDGDGDLGWPGEPGDGTGLGWPVDGAPVVAGEQPPVPLVAAGAPERRRGWRRIFGGSTAA
jgi:hypothetical protein